MKKTEIHRLGVIELAIIENLFYALNIDIGIHG